MKPQRSVFDLSPEQREELRARIWARVDRTTTPDGCWLWTGAPAMWGYGQINFAGRTWRVHRALYELEVGPLGLLLACHRCDVRLCVRPDHLFPGTIADNNRDAVAKGRQARGFRQGMHTHPEARRRGLLNGRHTHPEAGPIGEQHGRAKLTESAVRVIRASHAAGIPVHELSRVFQVSRRLILKVVERELWRHVA